MALMWRWKKNEKPMCSTPFEIYTLAAMSSFVFENVLFARQTIQGPHFLWAEQSIEHLVDEVGNENKSIVYLRDGLCDQKMLLGRALAL